MKIESKSQASRVTMDIDDVKLIENYLTGQKAMTGAGANFTEVVRSMINTPPISNEEIIKRRRKRWEKYRSISFRHLGL